MPKQEPEEEDSGTPDLVLDLDDTSSDFVDAHDGADTAAADPDFDLAPPYADMADDADMDADVAEEAAAEEEAAPAAAAAQVGGISTCSRLCRHACMLWGGCMV